MADLPADSPAETVVMGSDTTAKILGRAREAAPADFKPDFDEDM